MCKCKVCGNKSKDTCKCGSGAGECCQTKDGKCYKCIGDKGE